MLADSSSLEAEDGKGAEDCTSAEDGRGGGCGIVDCQKPEIVSEVGIRVCDLCLVVRLRVESDVECDDRNIVLVLVLVPLRVCVLVLFMPDTEGVHLQLRYEYVRTTIWSKTQRPC